MLLVEVDSEHQNDLTDTDQQVLEMQLQAILDLPITNTKAGLFIYINALVGQAFRQTCTCLTSRSSMVDRYLMTTLFWSIST